MRVLMAAACALTGGVAIALAAASPSINAPTPVEAVAANGTRVAYAASLQGKKCDRIHVWDRASGKDVQLGKATTCEETSTGTGTEDVSIAGTRVLWLWYTGGNERTWRLYTATTAKPKPHKLAANTRSVDADDPFVVGRGGGGILPYASGKKVTALGTNGSPKFTYTAGGFVVSMSAGPGRLAVATEGGDVSVLDASGHLLRTEHFTGPLDEVAIAGDSLVVHRGARTLERRAGGVSKTWTLAVDPVLEDATATVAAYVSFKSSGDSELHLLRFATGEDTVVARTDNYKISPHAALQGTTLVYALGRSVKTVSAAG